MCNQCDLSEEDKAKINKAFEMSVYHLAANAHHQIKNEMATLETVLRIYEKWGTHASEHTMIKCLGRIADISAKANYEAALIFNGGETPKHVGDKR